MELPDSQLGKTMGMLSDVFVADRNEATAILQDGPIGAFPTYQAKSLDPVTLGRLEAVLVAKPFAQIGGKLTSDHFESESGESGIHDVRPSLVEALAAMPSEAVARTAADWAEAEEWYGATGPDLEPIVRGLMQLAAQARQANKSLWVWWSL
jgi:hypothetical protein